MCFKPPEGKNITFCLHERSKLVLDSFFISYAAKPDRPTIEAFQGGFSVKEEKPSKVNKGEQVVNMGVYKLGKYCQATV